MQLEKRGSKEETKREMKMYRAHAAVCSFSSGMGKAGYQKSEQQLQAQKAPDLANRKAWGAYFGYRDASTKHEG